MDPPPHLQTAPTWIQLPGGQMALGFSVQEPNELGPVCCPLQHLRALSDTNKEACKWQLLK